MISEAVLSTVRDITLAPLGEKRIEWVKDFMPVLSELRERFIKEQPFKGLRISVCVHLEAKTAYLALVLRDGGAEVSVTGSNPLSTKDDICNGGTSRKTIFPDGLCRRRPHQFRRESGFRARGEGRRHGIHQGHLAG